MGKIQVCIDMVVDTCVAMRPDMCEDMRCVDLCVDICTARWEDVCAITI